MGGGGRIATVIPERRGESDFLFLFLGFFFLAGCLRGMYVRMKPPLALTIGADEIVWGRRGDERREVVARDATGWVRIEQETGSTRGTSSPATAMRKWRGSTSSDSTNSPSPKPAKPTAGPCRC